MRTSHKRGDSFRCESDRKEWRQITNFKSYGQYQDATLDARKSQRYQGTPIFLPRLSLEMLPLYGYTIFGDTHNFKYKEVRRLTTLGISETAYTQSLPESLEQ